MPRRNRTISPLRQTLPLDCQYKRRFSTLTQADTAAEEQMLLYPQLSLRTYRCEWCRNWHLTRRLKDT